VNTGAAVAAMVIALGYAVVNAFGTWMVARRNSGVAAGFFAAAISLTVGAMAVAFALPGAVVWVTSGALLASLSSWFNARLVMRRVVAWRHWVRFAVGVIVVASAYLAVRGA
jgi:hypothetical protein